jgi:hypothetical protein
LLIVRGREEEEMKIESLLKRRKRKRYILL